MLDLWYKNKEIMKLELKHLAPYLPYGLKVSYQDDKLEVIGISLDDRNIYVKSIDEGNYYIIADFAKPILRPLSDLDQDGEINTPEYLQGCCYLYVQNLISQHYDVFGLIEKGLAIDKNTLNN